MTLSVATTVNAASAATAGIVSAGAASNTVVQHAQKIPTFVPADQLYYWTREWQEGEAEALAELENGEGRVFADPKDAVRYLLSPE